MNSSLEPTKPPVDTPVSRKQRLQERLRELAASSERDIAKLTKSLEQMKVTLRKQKSQRD